MIKLISDGLWLPAFHLQSISTHLISSFFFSFSLCALFFLFLFDCLMIYGYSKLMPEEKSCEKSHDNLPTNFSCHLLSVQKNFFHQEKFEFIFPIILRPQQKLATFATINEYFATAQSILFPLHFFTTLKSFHH